MNINKKQMNKISIGNGRTTALRAVVLAGLMGLTMASQAAEGFQENFEDGWLNDPDTGTLGPKGAWPGTWAFRLKNPLMWSVVDSGGPQKKVFEFKGGPFNSNWWVGGTPHSVNYLPGKTLQLEGWIREATPTGCSDVAYLWLADPEHNGYGLMISRTNAEEGPPKRNDDKNYASILKISDNHCKFGGPETCNWKKNLPGEPVSVEVSSDEYLHFFLRLKQRANGSPVEIALYYTSTNNPPVMTWTDDGKEFGGILDLETLTWVGVTADNNNPIPHPIQFDSIGVSVITTR